MFGLGTQELVLILIVVLVIFGGKKIPELFTGLGKGIRSFKKSLNEDEAEAEEKTATKHEQLDKKS
jgi:sec-independent protein translocase protein TatA